MNDKHTCLFTLFTFWMNSAMVFIARCLLTFSALQFVVIVHDCTSLRLARNNRQRKLNTIQLRYLGLVVILLFCSVTATANAMDKVIVSLAISGHSLLAEVAHTPVSRAKGLMHRDSLGENSGMLFVFPKAGRYSMWMLSTHIPLSVAFVDNKGIILNIADMTPHTKTPHGSVGLAKYALEVNQGWFSVRGIRAGEKVTGLVQAPAAK